VSGVPHFFCISVFRFADQSDNGSFGIYLFRVKNNAEGHSK